MSWRKLGKELYGLPARHSIFVPEVGRRSWRPKLYFRPTAALLRAQFEVYPTGYGSEVRKWDSRVSRLPMVQTVGLEA